jgi:hypothetical protein
MTELSNLVIIREVYLEWSWATVAIARVVPREALLMLDHETLSPWSRRRFGALHAKVALRR